MKKDCPPPRVMLGFYKMHGLFLAMTLLALVIWQMNDFIASFAAKEYETVATLRTTEEKDDTRVLRAFQTAKRMARGTAVKFATEQNPEQRTRDSTLSITAKTQAEALSSREDLVSALKQEFAREAPGELFDISTVPQAKPVPNATMATVRGTCNGIALLVFVAGLALLVMQWKSSRLPKAALVGIVASVAVVGLILLGDEGSSIWATLLVGGLPLAFLVLIGYLTMRVTRAGKWPETKGRITQSKVEAVRHRFSGDTTKVRNVPSVAYAFNVAGNTIKGERISIGIGTADNVDQVIKRYPVGAEVPVFYDPANPQDCVLERNAPVSMGCLWGGALVVVLVYALVIAAVVSDKSISALASSAFPNVRHPIAMFITGALGLLSLASGIYSRLHPRKAFPWLRTPGVISSSKVESYKEDNSGSSGSMRTYFQAVIEYSYEVEGQKYHGNVQGDMGITVSSTNSKGAEERVARYPKGTPVEVFYNPEKPASSGLNVDTEIVLNGNRSLIMAALFLAIAIYLAM